MLKQILGDSQQAGATTAHAPAATTAHAPVDNHKCSFHFLDASFLRGLKLAPCTAEAQLTRQGTRNIEIIGDVISALGVPQLRQNNSLRSENTADTLQFIFRRLPRYQDLKRQHPQAFVEREVSLHGACTDLYKERFLAVTHRWERRDCPDVEGVQLREICDHVHANPQIEYVWIDYCCMPQRDADGNDLASHEREDFARMLPNINLIFLGCSVLILADLSYVSRFWTQFECWLAMVELSEDGLTGSGLREKRRNVRYDIKCIHNAPDSFETMLRQLWSDKVWVDAYRILSRPDVVVTNASDKVTQLRKIPMLNEAVKRIMRELQDERRTTAVERRQSSAASETLVDRLPDDGKAERSASTRSQRAMTNPIGEAIRMHMSAGAEAGSGTCASGGTSTSAGVEAGAEAGSTRGWGWPWRRRRRRVAAVAAAGA